MSELNENLEVPSEELREEGKAYFFHSDGDPEKRHLGLSLILKASSQNDPEAKYLVAKFILDGILTVKNGDPEEYALELMCFAANNGCIQARAYLNAYCEERYRKENANIATVESTEGIVGFDGELIKINRQGVFTPVDAVLQNVCGKNFLLLSTNLRFLYTEEFKDTEKFERAVIDGLLAWEGDYEVFGNQKLTVKVNVTRDDNLFDNLWIMPMSDLLNSRMQAIGNVVASSKRKEEIDNLVTNKRSCATTGIKWSVNSRKNIMIQSRNGSFDDYEEIMHVVKHEFGHALGLGDLYSSSFDSLAGVEKGSFAELDCYAIRDKYYNLVMCDHHGPISNNDIEMVILAFKENKMQGFQPSKITKKISFALGKGN